MRDTTKTDKEFDKKFLAFRDPDIVDGFAKDEIKSFLHSKIEEAYDEGFKQGLEEGYHCAFSGGKATIESILKDKS